MTVSAQCHILPEAGFCGKDWWHFDTLIHLAISICCAIVPPDNLAKDQWMPMKSLPKRHRCGQQGKQRSAPHLCPWQCGLRFGEWLELGSDQKQRWEWWHLEFWIVLYCIWNKKNKNILFHGEWFKLCHKGIDCRVPQEAHDSKLLGKSRCSDTCLW